MDMHSLIIYGAVLLGTNIVTGVLTYSHRNAIQNKIDDVKTTVQNSETAIKGEISKGHDKLDNIANAIKGQ